MFNEPENFEEKLEQAEESRLDGMTDRASRGVSDVFQGVYGELWIDEPGAPDRNDYDEVEQGYERYLYDLHEWALDNYQEAVNELAEIVDDLDGKEYPELGMHRLEDEEIRDASEDLIVDAKVANQDVIHWRQQLDRIEEAFGDR